MRRLSSPGTAKAAGPLIRRRVISLGFGEVARRSSESRQKDGSKARAAYDGLEITVVQLQGGYHHPPPANTGSATLLMDLYRTQIAFSALGNRTHVGTSVPS